MSSGRQNTDMAPAGRADGGNGDEGVVRVEGGRGVGGQSRGRQNTGAPLPHNWFPPGTSGASRRLSERILRRTVTGEQHVTDVIQQHKADPNVELWLHTDDENGHSSYADYPLLALCPDNLSDNRVRSIWAADRDVDDDMEACGCPVVLPMWQTPSLQLAIMRVLIERGADINAGDLCAPIVVAIRACNRAAFDLLIGQPGIQLQGRCVLMVPPSRRTDQPTEADEATLLSFYRELIQRDSTLATERDPDGTNPVHWAAAGPPVWSQRFIEIYLDLLVNNGADLRAVDNDGWTPLHFAADWGSHCVAASLCRRLAAADVNRGLPNDPTYTPLTRAAQQLDEDTQRLQDDNTEQTERDRATIRIPHVKTTIRVLLQAGGDIARMPTATQKDHRSRQLVSTVANELPIPEPRPATIEAQERLQKRKEDRDKRKGRQATRELREAPTAAELARQQKEADAHAEALIREEAAKKKTAANKKEASKKKDKNQGKRAGKRQPSTATSTSTSSPPGGEDDQADSSGAADDQDEDIDTLLLRSAFASRAVESQKQTTKLEQQKATPTRREPPAHTKESTRSPFSPFQPPTRKPKKTEQPSADRLLLSRPSGVSTADQTPREERLPGPLAGSKLGRGRGLGLPAAAPALLSRPAPPTPRLPSAEELRESARRRSFVSSSTSHPPPPPRPLSPAHQSPSGADDGFPPLAHASQQLNGSFPASSSGHRPSCHRGPPPLVKYPKGSCRRVEWVAEEGLERDAGSDAEDSGADGEDTDPVQRLLSAAAAADDADNKGTRRPNRHRPSSHSSGAAAACASASASPPSFRAANDARYPEHRHQDDSEDDEQSQMAIRASLHEATTAAMMMPPPSPPSLSLSSGGHASGASAAAAAPLGPQEDTVSRAMFPPSSSVDRPSSHRGPPPLVKSPKSLELSLGQDSSDELDDASCPPPLSEHSSYGFAPTEPSPAAAAAAATSSSNGYNYPSEPPLSPAAAAAAASASSSQRFDQSYATHSFTQAGRGQAGDGHPFSGSYDDSSQYHHTAPEPYEWPSWSNGSWANEDIPDSEVPLPGPIFENEEDDQTLPHSASPYAAAAAAGGGGDESIAGTSRENEVLKRENEELKRRLAELTVQQPPHSSQPPSSSSSSAPPPLQPHSRPQPQQPHGSADDTAGECVIRFGEHGAASIMYVPCKHLCVCGHCYADRRRRHEARVRRIRRLNARAESEADKRPIPTFECDICRKEVGFAGTQAEVRQWIERPFT
ncbi:unnamed protein product [Vitrella brassicaformis CCMP3155]|uniref:Uncharacterized protein n=1 Tax=Vitrella brassicaformis (strain CCMP3155) TaxID=1169540 RepID=A0A0G4F0X5_VITBC|nr:unnamed protein product [Vitrella brassicaformis CCMP3155]|eukprot:CEM05276.1 unnamed protein product [Vitrella brassicaformis CCMP3155]